MNSNLTLDLTNSPMEEMKQENTNMMNMLVEEESTYMVDKLMEFLCILALAFAFFTFLIVGFILHICLKTETSPRWQVQDWFCNGTSRQHRWRALHSLHRECMHEELFQKPAAKIEGEGGDKKKTRRKEERVASSSLLVERDEPNAICSYGTIEKIDHV